MSYRVLARKYRPRTFAEVVGQEHVVNALTGAIAKKRLGQAYLLIGPRGVGKTSTARILAKSVNCERGPTSTPCLECYPCREIEAGSDMDVIEIDGASNNGVEDVRGLRERVHFRPMRDRRKFYVIDEVQRLSGPAFDALLKTLEEPPDHAIFIFATTDPHKIPETIVSRCQTLEFRRLREQDVADKLRRVCQAEKVEVADEVLAAVAAGCRGGLRDAESILDQLLASATAAPTLEDLEQVAGLARPERWLDLLDAVEADDGPAILRAITVFLERGGTEHEFVSQVTEAVRDLLHIALLGEDSLGVTPAKERRTRTLDLARRLGRERLESLLGMLFSLERRIRQAPLAARALVEWTLLRAGSLGKVATLSGLMEEMRSGVVAAAVPTPSVAPDKPATPAKPEVPAEAPVERVSSTHDPSPAEGSKLPTLDALLKRVTLGRPTLGQLLTSRLLEGTVDPERVSIRLGQVSKSEQSLLDDPTTASFLSSLPKSPPQWEIQVTREDPPAADPVADQLRSLFGAREENS